MKKSLIGLSVLALLAVAAFFIHRYYTQIEESSIPGPEPFRLVDTGLTKNDSAQLHHIYQGTTLFPISMLHALKDPKTGKLMKDSLADYGFLLAHPSPTNPWGLPVGLSGQKRDAELNLNMPEVGINCAACHTGQIHYQEGETIHRLRIDGAPNMIDVEKWILDTANNAERLLTHPGEAIAFVARFIHASHAGVPSLGEQLGLEREAVVEFLEEATEPDTDGTEDLDDTGHPETDALIDEMQEDFHPLLERLADHQEEPTKLDKEKFEALSPPEKTMHAIEHFLFIVRERIKKGRLTIESIKESPAAGPGRDDAWGLVQRIVMQDASAKLNAPIVVPHLFGNKNYTWYHADGNTNSVMDRNLAQGIALGADVEEDGETTSLLPRQINRMDQLLGKLEAPSWPKEFPELDETKRALGEELFNAHCAKCHSDPAGKDYPLKLIGTNPARWETFNLKETNGPERLTALTEKVAQVRKATFKARGISEELGRSWEQNGNPEWRQTIGYRAHVLNGIWASPPYLHNGSVRTLYQLLLPEAEREKTFYVGNRLYDPKEVGYVNEPGATNYLYDTSDAPNTNEGHLYGTTLSDEERWSLVE